MKKLFTIAIMVLSFSTIVAQKTYTKEQAREELITVAPNFSIKNDILIQKVVLGNNGSEFEQQVKNNIDLLAKQTVKMFKDDQNNGTNDLLTLIECTHYQLVYTVNKRTYTSSKIEL